MWWGTPGDTARVPSAGRSAEVLATTFFLFFSEVGWNSAGKHQEFCLKSLQIVTWGISSLWMKKKSQKTELKTILLSGSGFFKKKVFFSTVAVVHSPTWRHLVPFEMCYRSPQLTDVTPKEYSPPMTVYSPVPWSCLSYERQQKWHYVQACNQSLHIIFTSSACRAGQKKNPTQYKLT